MGAEVGAEAEVVGGGGTGGGAEGCRMYPPALDYRFGREIRNWLP